MSVNLDEMANKLLETVVLVKELSIMRTEIMELKEDLRESITNARRELDEITSTDDYDYHEGRAEAYELVLIRLERIFG